MMEVLEELEGLELRETALVKSYTDLISILHGGKHALSIGMTGSGKTTLLFFLLDLFFQKGYKIIFRDDMGLEFLMYYKLLNDLGYSDKVLNIFIPEEVKFKINEEWNNVYIQTFDYRKPEDLVFKILRHEAENSFNTIVFDKYNPHPELSASFWSDFLLHFILYISDLPHYQKERIILSIDELNDLVQSNQSVLTEEHGKLRGIFEYNIRKIRKQGVTILATTHRLQQMTRSTTSQFAYTFLKKSEGADVYDFLNRKLIAVKNTTFWRILHDVITLPPQFVYCFDYKGNFDKLKYPDILAPVRNKKIKFITYGRIRRVSDKKIDLSDVYILLYRLKGLPFRDISNKLKIPQTTVIDHYKNLIDHKEILELVSEINMKAIPRSYKNKITTTETKKRYK
ncbi:MAG: hypothetical protein ACP6IU_14990 [Candidatus Asgardarchaeia archaeon]